MGPVFTLLFVARMTTFKASIISIYLLLIEILKLMLLRIIPEIQEINKIPVPSFALNLLNENLISNVISEHLLRE